MLLLLVCNSPPERTPYLTLFMAARLSSVPTTLLFDQTLVTVGFHTVLSNITAFRMCGRQRAQRLTRSNIHSRTFMICSSAPAFIGNSLRYRTL